MIISLKKAVYISHGGRKYKTPDELNEFVTAFPGKAKALVEMGILTINKKKSGTTTTTTTAGKTTGE